MKHKSLISLFTSLVMATIMLALSTTVLAQDDKNEHVVITLQKSPLINPEPACVALQLGLNLLTLSPPVAKLTLFPTLDGVEIVSNKMRIRESGRYPRRLNCSTPEGEVPLPELLNRFKDQADIMVCPLCWMVRYGGAEKPIYGEMGGGQSIHNLFYEADKVIDY